MRKGIRLEDGMTAPARARVIEKLKKNAWVEIEVHEGRKREVRRMFEALGYFVEKLIRVRVGSVSLGLLPQGELRPLSRSEIQSLQIAKSAYKAPDIIHPLEGAYKRKGRLLEPPSSFHMSKNFPDLMTQAAELFVVDQLMNRRMIAAHRAIRIAAQIQRIDLHRQAC